MQYGRSTFVTASHERARMPDIQAHMHLHLHTPHMQNTTNQLATSNVITPASNITPNCPYGRLRLRLAAWCQLQLPFALSISSMEITPSCENTKHENRKTAFINCFPKLLRMLLLLVQITNNSNNNDN